MVRPDHSLPHAWHRAGSWDRRGRGSTGSVLGWGSQMRLSHTQQGGEQEEPAGPGGSVQLQIRGAGACQGAGVGQGVGQEHTAPGGSGLCR